MSKEPSEKKKESFSWHSIRQKGTPAVTPEAQKKVWFNALKWTSLACFALIFFIGIGWGVFCFKTKTASVNVGYLSQALSSIEVYTDGVLPESLILKASGVEEGTLMMNIDIFELKQRLESIDQIKSVDIERQFPSSLKIAIQEYQPVFKVLTQESSGKKLGLLVSAEGHIYRGYGYSNERLKKLIYLQGFNLKQQGSGFEPLMNLEAAAILVQTAAQEHPNLYKTWKSISLKNFRPGLYDPGSFLSVYSKNVGELIFSVNNIREQLERLHSVLEYSSEQHLAAIERIDLSLGNQVAVKLIRH